MSSENYIIKNAMQNKLRKKRRRIVGASIATIGFVVLLFLYFEERLLDNISEIAGVDQTQLQYLIMVLTLVVLIAAIYLGFDSLQYSLTIQESLFRLSEQAMVDMGSFLEKRKNKHKKKTEKSILKIVLLIKRYIQTSLKFLDSPAENELKNFGENLSKRLLPVLKNDDESLMSSVFRLLRDIHSFLSNSPISLAELEKVNILLETLPIGSPRKDFWSFLSPILKRPFLRDSIIIAIIMIIGSASFIVSTSYLKVPLGYAYSSAIVIITSLISLYLRYRWKKT